MALLQHSSLPISLTNILPLKRKSTLVATKPFQCRASNNSVPNSQSISRRSTKFQPSIWSYDYIQSLSSEYMDESYKEKNRVLREEVRMMLSKVVNHLDQLELIDVLQRLGVAYHFINEIRNILGSINNMNTSKGKKNLHATSLEFRLLRQHGYNISTDVFVRFLDEVGNFKKCPSFGAKEMLSLYEASFHSLEDETIMNEARDFSVEFLKEYLTNNKSDHLSLLTSHALELPLHWRIDRWEAQCFIDAYRRRENMSPTILQLAILDFNIVQAIYQEELKCTSRWWKRIGLAEKLSFTRDRLVQNYVWTVGTKFKPNFRNFRIVITKVNSLITTIDDIYDAYGTFEELQLFTKAIDRWDPKTIDNLPKYMRICFLALYNFVNELGHEVLKEKGCYVTPYLKEAWTDLCKSYFTEAKWYHNKYTPSLEEYMENAWISISAPAILTNAYFLVPHSFINEDFVYVKEHSNIIRFSAMILRIANDLGTYKRENETGDIPKSIQCYMNETGVSEKEACQYMTSMMHTTWKKMNKETCNSSFPESFKDVAINLARIALYKYQHGDGHTIQDPKIKSRIVSLIFQPIPDLYAQKSS